MFRTASCSFTPQRSFAPKCPGPILSPAPQIQYSCDTFLQTSRRVLSHRQPAIPGNSRYQKSSQIPVGILGLLLRKAPGPAPVLYVRSPIPGRPQRQPRRRRSSPAASRRQSRSSSGPSPEAHRSHPLRSDSAESFPRSLNRLCKNTFLLPFGTPLLPLVSRLFSNLCEAGSHASRQRLFSQSRQSGRLPVSPSDAQSWLGYPPFFPPNLSASSAFPGCGGKSCAEL